ncbi:MAG: IS3 family transposase [Faecalimonas umbilicata]
MRGKRNYQNYLEAFYNTKRIHSHCDYMSPNDYEKLHRKL